MDANLATVIVAAIAAFATSVVAPIVTFWLKYAQDRRIAAGLNRKVDITVAGIEKVHESVNGRMREMEARLHEKMDLLLEIAPDDPRVRKLFMSRTR